MSGGMRRQLPQIRADDPTVLAVAALVRPELAAEAAAGFPTLRHIPSTGAIKLLDYLATLSSDELAALLDAQARVAALHFFPGPLIVSAFEELRLSAPIMRRAEAWQAPAFSYGLRYCDLRMARAMLRDAESLRHMAQTRAALDFTPRDDPPPALLGTTAIRDVETAKAPLLRKLLNPMLRSRLGARPSKRPGGELAYEGAIGDVPLRLSIIFSNMYGQMHYGVTWSMRERNLSAQRLNYETLWGTNTGWDYLTEDNAARSIDLLGELLLRLARLAERVAVLPNATLEESA